MSKVKQNLLINRMDIENVNKLLEWNNTYPATTEVLINELMEKEYYVHLSYGSIITLHNALECGYEPADIHKLFNQRI